MAQPNPTNQELFEVTWTVYGSKEHRSQNVLATTPTEAKGTIRRQELANGDQVYDITSVKQWKEVA